MLVKKLCRSTFGGVFCFMFGIVLGALLRSCPKPSISIIYPGNVEFHQLYERFRTNPANFDVNIKKWHSNLTLILGEAASCEENHHPALIVLVKTTPKKRSLREHIRKTWGNATCFAGNNMTALVLFVLGKNQPLHPERHPNYQEMLKEEHKEYRDLLQFDVVESYRNTSRKNAAALSYISEHCPNSRFVAMFDDDFLVNPASVVQTLNTIPPLHYPIFVGGYTHDSESIQRYPAQKFFIPPNIYPFEVAPRFAAGGSLLMSMQVAKFLAFGLHLIPYIPIDDIAMGLVLFNFGISPTHLSGVRVQNQFWELNDTQRNQFISMHEFGDVELQKVAWKELKNPCGINKRSER